MGLKIPKSSAVSGHGSISEEVQALKLHNDPKLVERIMYSRNALNLLLNRQRLILLLLENIG